MIAVVIVIDALAALVSMEIVVLNARSAVTVETQASLATVELLAADTIGLSQAEPRESLLRTLDLRFQALRHVRVGLFDAEGRSLAVLPPVRRDRHIAPSWFVALIAPPVQRHELPIWSARTGSARRGSPPSPATRSTRSGATPPRCRWRAWASTSPFSPPSTSRSAACSRRWAASRTA